MTRDDMQPIREIKLDRIVGPRDPFAEPAPDIRTFHSIGRSGAIGQTSVPISTSDLGELDYVQMTNYRGDRVWVSPLCHIDGDPVYPPVHLPPGEERRKVESAINARYDAYRRNRKGGGGHADKPGESE